MTFDKIVKVKGLGQSFSSVHGFHKMGKILWLPNFYHDIKEGFVLSNVNENICRDGVSSVHIQR